MDLNTILLVSIKTITLVCGVILTWLSFKAYRRTGAESLRALGFGIGFITAGTMLAGGVHQLLNFPLIQSSIVQSLFTATGFVMLIYSLYAKQPTTG